MKLVQAAENRLPCVFEDEVVVARSAATETDFASENGHGCDFLTLPPGTIVEVLPTAAGISQDEAEENLKEVDASIAQAQRAPTESVGQLVFAVLGPRPSSGRAESSSQALEQLGGESPSAALGEVVVRWVNGTFDVRVLQHEKEPADVAATVAPAPVLYRRLPRSRLRLVPQSRKKEIKSVEDEAFTVDRDGVSLFDRLAWGFSLLFACARLLVVYAFRVCERFLPTISCLTGRFWMNAAESFLQTVPSWRRELPRSVSVRCSTPTPPHTPNKNAPPFRFFARTVC